MKFIGSKEILGWTKFFGQKNFGDKNMFGVKKKFGPKKMFGSKYLIIIFFGQIDIFDWKSCLGWSGNMWNNMEGLFPPRKL